MTTVSAGQTSSGLMVSSGATLTVLAGGTVVNTKVLSGGSETLLGGLDSSGTVFSGGQLTISAGGVASSTVVAGGSATIYNSGVAIDVVVSGSTAIGIPALYLSSGATATNTTVVGPANFDVYNGATVSKTALSSGGFELVAGIASNTTVNSGAFEYVLSGGAAIPIPGNLVTSGGIEHTPYTSAFTGQIMVGGLIDLYSATYSGGPISFNSATDILTVVEGGTTTSIQLVGDYSSDTFTTSAPSSNQSFSQGLRGTIVTVNAAPCYCPGTLILTDQGEWQIEQLRIGGVLITISGAHRLIKWIGRRSYTGRTLASNKHILPIRISAGALGGGLPRRDLRVSPLHAMMLDGLLVPAWQLINGISIIQETDCQQVDYIHIELETHDVIWAEGAASETFLDDDSRFMFHNASEHTAMYPDEVPSRKSFCAPRVEDGYQLEAIRDRLAAIARERQPA